MSVEAITRSFAVVGHTYQPEREFFLPVGTKLQIVPDENEKIYQQCYRPNFVDTEGLPEGFVVSFYPTLREWMKQAHPEGFDRIREKVQRMPDKEYNVLGDPYLHVIMPLLPDQDQDMLLKFGRLAFREDLGFEPKGLWLPETAVSYETLQATSGNGYEFVVLRDSQITNRAENPVYVELSDTNHLAVVHLVSGLSGDVSFNEWSTMNADIFLAEWIHDDRRSIAIGTDTELYGHHRDAVKWLEYLLKPDTLANHGFAPLSIRTLLALGERTYTDVAENSSWSCDHNLGRWTGECNCGGATEETQSLKRALFKQLTEANTIINQQLDTISFSWRQEFIETFLKLRTKIFTGQDFLTELKEMVSSEKFTLFAAKIYTLLGFTSCGWFDGKVDSPERAIPQAMTEVVQRLLRGKLADAA